MKLKSIITVCILLTSSYSAISAWKIADVKALAGACKGPILDMSFNEETGVMIGIDISGVEDINNLDLSGIIFQDCRFKMTHFNECILTNCKFLDCNCEAAHFDECTLDEIEFAGKTKIDGAHFFEGAIIRNAKFIGISAEKICFINAKFENVSFEKATLDGAFFVFAKLIKSTFAGASLKGAHFGGATVEDDVNFEDVDLGGIHVKNAQFGEGIGLRKIQKKYLQNRGATFTSISAQ